MTTPQTNVGVETTPIIEAYLCSVCKKKFFERDKANKHYKQCFKKQLAEQEKQKFDLDEANFMRLNVESINDIPRMVAERIEKLGGKISASFDLSFKEDIPTSHSRPVGWEYKDPRLLPDQAGWSTAKLPGWKGHISGDITLAGLRWTGEVEQLCFNDIFGNEVTNGHHHKLIKGINSGGGGSNGGGRGFRYEVTLFLEDFPKLKAKYKQYVPLVIEQKMLYQKVEQLEKIYISDHNGLMAEDANLLEYKTHIAVMESAIKRLNEIIIIRNNQLSEHAFQSRRDEFKQELLPLKYDSKTLYELRTVLQTSDTMQKSNKFINLIDEVLGKK